MFDRVSWMFHFPRISACEKYLGMRNTENHAFPSSIIGSIGNPFSLASVEAGPAPPPPSVQHSQDASPYVGMTPHLHEAPHQIMVVNSIGLLHNAVSQEQHGRDAVVEAITKPPMRATVTQ
jgi:hypothetical protein